MASIKTATFVKSTKCIALWVGLCKDIPSSELLITSPISATAKVEAGSCLRLA